MQFEFPFTVIPAVVPLETVPVIPHVGFDRLQFVVGSEHCVPVHISPCWQQCPLVQYPERHWLCDVQVYVSSVLHGCVGTVVPYVPKSALLSSLFSSQPLPVPQLSEDANSQYVVVLPNSPLSLYVPPGLLQLYCLLLSV